MNEKKILYRYYSYDATTCSVDEWDNVIIHSPDYRLKLEEITVDRETKKCYVIYEETDVLELTPVNTTRKFVRKEGKKRYAYPTKEEALVGYIKRTERYISILKEKTNFASECLKQAKNIQDSNQLEIIK